jgi:hypothetical protein
MFSRVIRATRYESRRPKIDRTDACWTRCENLNMYYLTQIGVHYVLNFPPWGSLRSLDMLSVITKADPSLCGQDLLLLIPKACKMGCKNLILVLDRAQRICAYTVHFLDLHDRFSFAVGCFVLAVSKRFIH